MGGCQRVGKHLHMDIWRKCRYYFKTKGCTSCESSPKCNLKLLSQCFQLSAWRVATALPNALESTLLILSVSLQDEPDNYSRINGTSLVLRQSYSLALIRFVNGLVDPLQSGVFARPIVSIAAQIGLPLWMVELRHAGTHEDLPSLEVLREGAKEASILTSTTRFFSL